MQDGLRIATSVRQCVLEIHHVRGRFVKRPGDGLKHRVPVHLEVVEGRILILTLAGSDERFARFRFNL